MGSGFAVPASLSASAAGGHIRDLMRQKQEELLEIHEYRVREAEARTTSKESECEDLKRKLAKLKEDFQYNLRLMEDRDDELRRYDVVIDNLKTLVGERDAQMDEMRTQLAEAVARNQQHSNEIDVREEHLKARLAEQANRVEDAARRHSVEMQELRAECDRKVRAMQARIEVRR